MQFFTQTIAELASFRELQTCIEKHISPVSLTGVSNLHKAQLLAALAGGEPMLVVTEDEASSKRLCEDINRMLGQSAAFAYPSKEPVLTEVEGFSREYEHTRIAALTALLTGECRILAASAEAVLQPTLPLEVLIRHTLTLREGEDASPAELMRLLCACGYTRCEKVEGPSQCALRGSLLDVFPVQAAQPVRLEFWGDTIDSINTFDPETQRRMELVESVHIAPAQETIVEAQTLADRI